ncbi:phosphatidate cytidylyltransferase [Sphingomonas sp. Leaf25]|uniref:phosphatidate cytidylyltransferase n=1 Tax=Sphingomonas sp. Leaf25 TaxID=1735692 RepID=UPI0006F4432D|nr:phosphatidate cytidylyltransferase [Sphingomonas sp. Leaf25]KQN03955.1 phosphatidate cytidylyltransferase [Sphingomonas sp. Leaf25]
MSEQDPVKRRKSDLAVRTVASIGMIGVAALALWFGQFAFWLLVAIGSLFMMAEWADLYRVSRQHKRLAQYALMVPLAILSPLAAGAGFLTLGLIAGAAFFIVIVTRQPGLARGIVYCGLPALAIVLLRDRPDGLLLAFWAMALVWACDIGAYFAGRSIGGPKLAPTISPNKTWAGLIGGVIAASVFASVLYEVGLPFHLVAATPLLAVLAQMGDLYESQLKRKAGVKDSGNVLPGHGGVMDRLDGLVPVAPAAALMVLLAGRLV